MLRLVILWLGVSALLQTTLKISFPLVTIIGMDLLDPREEKLKPIPVLILPKELIIPIWPKVLMLFALSLSVPKSLFN